MLKLFFLGPPRVELQGETVEIGLRKGLALLIYLGVTRQPHTRDALATMFWPEHSQTAGRARLRRTLYALNQVAGETLVATVGDMLQLEQKHGLWLDIADFEGHIADCLSGSGPEPTLPGSCLQRLEQAAALYKDDFLAGFTLPDSLAFDEWQFFQREDLRQRLAAVLEQLVYAHQAAGSWQEAAAHARRWVALDPLHESAHRAAMTVYALAGQQAAALRQYEQCKELLEEELGVEPDEETTALYEQIRRRELVPVEEPELLEPQLPAAPARSGPRHNLPAPTTPFVGRERELALLDGYLTAPQPRLITLSGPGGMGKTRLALAVAARHLPTTSGTFADGVYFVPLASLQRAEEIVAAVADALQFTFESSPRRERPPQQQLLDYLGHKQMLLILDNFEQLLPHTELVAEILETAPGIKLLVTSRERLYLRDEQLLMLQGLDLPAVVEGDGEELTRSAAMRLFLQSARRVQHDFAFDANSARHAARICVLLEGMPLGVELAAAWADALPLEEIAAEIERSLDFLQSDMRDVPERQRSVRAVFETTWARLSKDEQEAFASLSVFRGGFSRAAAAAVAGIDLRMLHRLAGKSLLQYRAEVDRYRVHELLRQCAAERLALAPEAEAAARDRHSAFFCSALRRWQDDIEGADKRSALLAIEHDLDNVQLAWEVALAQGRLERLEQAMSSLEHFFYWRSRFHQAEAFYQNAAERLSALPTPAGSEALYQRVLTALQVRYANFSYLLENWDEARERFEQGLAALGALDAMGYDVRLDRAYIYMKMGDVTADLAEAERLFRESLALYESGGHRWWTAGLHTHLGYVALARRDYEEAAKRFATSMALYEELGDRWQLGWVLDGMSHLALYRERLEEAERLARDGLALHREIGLRDRIADSLTTLSWITLAAGRPDDARAIYDEAHALWSDLGVEERISLPAGLEDQPFTPLWFRDIIDQRLDTATRAGSAGDGF